MVGRSSGWEDVVSGWGAVASGWEVAAVLVFLFKRRVVFGGGGVPSGCDSKFEAEGRLAASGSSSRDSSKSRWRDESVGGSPDL